MVSDQVPAARRAMALLRELAGRSSPVPASQLARVLGIPRSSTYHLLAALQAEGFVTHLPEERRWALGVSAFELGTAFLRQDRLQRLARPLLADLAMAHQLTAHLGVLDGRDVLYVVKEHPRGTPPVVTEVGVRLPAHLTASGRALLAGLSRAQLSALYPGRAELSDRTGRGPRTPAALRAQLAVDAGRGWAHEEEEVAEGVASVAVAATDHLGRPAAAVTLTGRVERVPDPAWLARVVGVTAAALTERLAR